MSILTNPRSQDSASSTKTEFLPPKLRDLFFRPGLGGKPVYVPSSYKIAYGGRASGKSYGFANMAVVLGAEIKLRIMCVREYQSSLKESVYDLIVDRIEQLGLTRYYRVYSDSIMGLNGTRITFSGIKQDVAKIKSTFGIDLCLVEEAEKVSENSWQVLIPTVLREPGSELWITFNPNDERDPTYKRFVLETPPNTRRCFINWNDNPFFTAESEELRAYAYSLIARATEDDERLQAQADYDHVWEGATRNNSVATIFRKRVLIHAFDDPDPNTNPRFLYGADWGFSVDPTAVVRMWTTRDEKNREELWISHEAFGYGVELNELPQLFDSIPGIRDGWPIKGDCARPETISYMAKEGGFNIMEAEKWSGSLEDGIEHIKAFSIIHIHTRCKHMQQEARLYSYKIDRVTNEVLPVVVDAHNHGWDAVRYGLDGFIQKRGYKRLWEKLGQ